MLLIKSYWRAGFVFILAFFVLSAEFWRIEVSDVTYDLLAHQHAQVPAEFTIGQFFVPVAGELLTVVCMGWLVGERAEKGNGAPLLNFFFNNLVV